MSSNDFKALQSYLLGGSDTDEGLTFQEQYDELMAKMPSTHLYRFGDWSRFLAYPYPTNPDYFKYPFGFGGRWT